MNQSKQLSYPIIVTLIIVLLVWLFYQSIEFYEQTEKSAWSDRAIRDPYLAAQQFLEASGLTVIEAESLLQLETLDGVGTALITDANQVGNPRQLESVVNWLELGGRLIVIADKPDHSESLLLSRFHVEVEQPDTDVDEVNHTPPMSDTLREYNEKIEQGMTPKEIEGQQINETSLTIIDFGEAIGSVKIHFDSLHVLNHPYLVNADDQIEPKPFSWSLSDYGVHSMQFKVGDGLLTIISDPGIWQSWKIDQHDHAYFLWILTSARGDFALLKTTYRESVWTLAIDYGYEGLFAMTLLVLGLIWRRGQRLGRILPFPKSARRSMGEHFSATANYLWRNEAGEALLQPLRHHTLQLACRAIPGFERADKETRLGMIANHCQLDKHAISQALRAKKFTEQTFVRTVKLLKDIEQSL